uniref:Predicted protein n=1 Tax=Hordeum vulgare subsp. vulgare TaxID=112509 RepID=F2DC07_HORVV|nr:predicted protein [Hordeum vulgare subsp. vulgare]
MRLVVGRRRGGFEAYLCSTRCLCCGLGAAATTSSQCLCAAATTSSQCICAMKTGPGWIR